MEGVCVGLVSVDMSVLFCVCVRVRSALQAGGSERLGPFSTGLIKDTHSHNWSNELWVLRSPSSALVTLVFFNAAWPFFFKQQ